MNNKFRYILFEARNFADTYKLLKKQVNFYEEQVPYIIPSVVVITFCSELYLKAILDYYSINFKKERGHKLDYLFNLLASDKKSPAYASYSNIEENFKKKKAETKSRFLYNNLEEMLKNENNSFEMWRYHFDNLDNYRAMFPAFEFRIFCDCLEEECQLLEEKSKELSVSE